MNQLWLIPVLPLAGFLLNGLVALLFVISQFSFANQFHANDSFAVGMQLLQDRDHHFRGRVHAHTVRIDARMHRINPGLLGRRLQGCQGVTGDTVSPDATFSFELRQQVHLLSEFLRPCGGFDTM